MTEEDHRRFDDRPPRPMRHALVPALHYDHPGYFKVVLSLILIHLGLTLDGKFTDRQRNSPIFQVLNDGLSGNLWLLAVAHLLIAVLILAGLYWPRHFGLLRFGCGLSLILFNVIAVAFIAAAIKNHLSFYAALASITLSLSSLAAMKEPIHQPAKRT